MGGLLIRNNELRCKDCFKLYTFKIKPEYPISKLTKKCKCSTNDIELINFLSEYKKNKNLSISCSKCNKTNPKDPNYCKECQKLYCINCNKEIHKEENNKNHNLITIEKYDFYCICHQNDNFNAYCKTCKIDICSKCTQEKLHEGHKVLFYNKIYDEKKMREYYRKAIRLAEAKIEYNRKVCSMINKEIKKNEKVKSLKRLNEANESENKNILEAINIFHELYDISKPKNYCLIVNLVDNINFNLERIKFEKNTSKEKDAEDLSNYFKADFILESLNKKEVPATLEEQFFNDKFNVQFEEEKNENKEKKENEDKNEEKKEETKEAEELKKEEEEDDGREKTIAEKKEIIKKKINEKGGFQQAASNPVGNSNEAPKTTNDNVVNILNSQTINKKVKKKPKKINFQS